MDLVFVKMHGLGNDYVYVDGFTTVLPADPAGIARRISDRHRGVGGDGLILVEPSGRAAARMRIFNADGSEAEMCGNGLRCVAHLVASRGHAGPGRMMIETGRGLLQVEVFPESERRSRVEVDMGPPILPARDVPVDIGARPDEVVIGATLPGQPPAEEWVRASGLEPGMTCVSMGNPHAIFYCRDVEAVPLEVFGPAIETHPAFPRRTNVHVVQVEGEARVRMRTWERGSGITQACGTGASAVCVAGRLTGRSGPRITATLPGGDLDLRWDGEGSVWMTGPAEEVFTGTWYHGT